MMRESPADQSMTPSRDDLKRRYKERKIPSGIFCIRNTTNGKVYLGSSRNLDGPLNKHRFMLTYGSHQNEALQHDWNTDGPDAFIFEILEVVRVTDDPSFDLDEELTLLEEIWTEKLQPFGPRGYNTRPSIREA